MIGVKICAKCGVVKRLCNNGRFICDPCNRAKSLSYRAANLEIVQAKDRARISTAMPEKKRAKHKAWRDLNREHVRVTGRETMKRLYNAEPQKFRDRSAQFYAANTEKCQATSNEWKKENRDRVNQYAKDYRQENLPHVKEALKRWREKNRDHVSAYSLERFKWKYQNDPSFRLKHNIGCLIRIAIVKKGFAKTSRTHEVLGCGYEFFKAHIERQFLKGMSWENRDSWHLDHITPIATAKTEDEVLALNHFSNLRPMWAKDNLSKGAKITHLI